MYKFKINKLVINTGHGQDEIIPKKINVLVGPNNSGKSRFLKEIRDYLSGDHNDLRIISAIEYPFPADFKSLDDAYNVSSKILRDYNDNWMLKVYSNKPSQPLDMTSSLESYFTKNLNLYGGNWEEYLRRIIEEKDYLEFFRLFGSLFFQYMGTEERLTICKTQRDYGLDSNSANFLTSFKYQEQLLNDLTQKVKKLFCRDIFLDAQTLGDRLVFRVGDNFDYIRTDAVRTEDVAFKLFSEKKLDEQGDGLKSFVSTFLSLKYNNSDVLLLDEPEAFLHPPLARQLGEIIGENSAGDKVIFIATHSVEVLKGILSKNHDVNVIRITQATPDVNDVAVLDQSVLTSILNNPLLRVSRVLEGIFCERVIITEAEADELVYQELVEKIFPESGAFFAHGQNKQTLATIAELYQKIGIDYDIITDFDVLRQPSELYKFLLLMPLDERDRQRIQGYAQKLREKIEASVETTGLSEEECKAVKKKKRDEVYHEKGTRYFEEDYANQIRKSLEKLSDHHLHVLETGELETLLEDYGVSYKEKNIWIVEAIEKIAELSIEDIDVDGLVHKFIKRIIHN